MRRLFLIICIFCSGSYFQPISAVELSEILKRYDRAHGGFTLDQETRSIRIRGEMEQQGETFEFVLYKRAPRSMRFECRQTSGSSFIVYNGKEAWFWNETEPESAKQLKGDALATVEQEAYFGGWLDWARSEGMGLELVEASGPSAEIPNQPFKIRATSRNGDVVGVVSLAPQSFLEIERALFVLREGAPVVTKFRDYREVNGFPVPHLVESFVGEELVAKTVVSEVAPNVGLLSLYFERP